MLCAASRDSCRSIVTGVDGNNKIVLTNALCLEADAMYAANLKLANAQVKKTWTDGDCVQLKAAAQAPPAESPRPASSF